MAVATMGKERHNCLHSAKRGRSTTNNIHCLWVSVASFDEDLQLGICRVYTDSSPSDKYSL